MFISILSCISKREWGRARALIHANPSDVYSIQNNSGRTALHTILSLNFECDDDGGSGSEDFEEALNLVKFIIDASIESSPSIEPNFGINSTGSHESLLLVRDFNANTPLHSLCGRGCASPAMLRLVFSYCSRYYHEQQLPSAIDIISAVNDQGCTPLHFLAECRCPFESMKIMLMHCAPLRQKVETLSLPLEPDKIIPFSKSLFQEESEKKECEKTSTQIHPCLIQDDDGDTPLHFTCSVGGPVEFLSALLEHCPVAITRRNKDGHLPIDDLWIWGESEWSEMCEDHFHDEPQINPRNNNADNLLNGLLDITDPYINSEVDSSSWNEDKNALKGNLWNLVSIYLEASCYGTVHRARNKDDVDCWRPLHAAATLTHCNTNILRFVLHMVPDQLDKYDEYGRLPIHAAASTKSTFLSPLKNINFLCDADRNVNVCKRKTFCEDHMLPLHLAIESGKDMNVINSIHKRYPKAFEERAIKNGLHPWMLAAVGMNNSTNVIYSLLRMNPELVRGGIPIEHIETQKKSNQNE